jgi:hypothetical protein
MEGILMVDEKRCYNCNTLLEDKAEFCPECGEKYIPKPTLKLSIWQILGLIFVTILFFPLGIIIIVLMLWGQRKAVEDWQTERLIAAQHNK